MAGTNFFTVRMLGSFEVFYGNSPVVRKEDRNSKLLQLLAYLLYNKNRMISQSSLTDEVLNSGDDNSLNVLKNLVYRIRKLLSAAGASADFLVYKSNCYGFSDEVEIKLDVDAFEELATQLEAPDCSDKKTLEAYKMITDIYNGDFLQRSYDDLWVLGACAKYQKMFNRCTSKASAAAARQGAYAEYIDCFRKAAAIYPYEEPVNMAYISALFNTNDLKGAIQQCDRYRNLLMDGLGVFPSAEFDELYGLVMGGVAVTHTSASEVRQELAEGETPDGAFYCAPEIFKGIYRISVRKAVRSGQSLFLLMCTVRENDGSTPVTGERLHEVSRAFGDSVASSLRTGDVYTRNSPTQFVLMLTDLTQENCNVIAERLRKTFYSKPHMKNMRVVCDYISGIDINELL